MAWVSLGWGYFHEADIGTGYNTEKDREAVLTSAKTCAEKALELDPSCADAYALLGLCHLSEQQYDEAIAMTKKGNNSGAQSCGEPRDCRGHPQQIGTTRSIVRIDQKGDAPLSD